MTEPTKIETLIAELAALVDSHEYGMQNWYHLKLEDAKLIVEALRQAGQQAQPQARELTDEEIDLLWLSLSIDGGNGKDFARSVIAADRAIRQEQAIPMVPRNPRPELICGDVAISIDPRYSGWVFVRHVDGENWTTGAKLTAETWAMIASQKEQGK